MPGPIKSVGKKYKIRGKAIYKYKAGDLVRVSFIRKAFQQEYDERWSRELFVVNGRFVSDDFPQYRLKDYAGEVVSGTFYQNQLKKPMNRRATSSKKCFVLALELGKSKSWYAGKVGHLNLTCGLMQRTLTI